MQPAHSENIEHNSSYKILIDKGDFNQNGRPARGSRTKNLLSGGFGKPPADIPISANMTPFNHFGAPPTNYGNTPAAYDPRNARPYQSTQGIYQTPQVTPDTEWPSRAPYAPAAAYTTSYPQGNPSYFGQNSMFARPNPLFPDLNTNPSRKNLSRHRRHRHRRSTKPWYKDDSRKTTSSSASDKDSGWWKRSRKSNASRSRRYGLDSDSEMSSVSASSYSGALNPLQKKVILNTLREYCPDNMKNIVYEDLIAQMELMEKKGYKLPKDYNKREHDISENEIKLYEQQLQRDKGRNQKKMSGIINFAAVSLSWFCRFISVDSIKTRHLPDLVKSSLQDGDFDEIERKLCLLPASVSPIDQQLGSPSPCMYHKS